MTKEELNKIKKRADAATPGPWVAKKKNDCDYIGLYQKHDDRIALIWTNSYEATFRQDADTVFCAHAREDIPKLVAEVERLQKLVEETD